MRICSLAIHPPHKGVYDWTLTQAEEGSRSTTSSSFNLTGKGDWQQTFTLGRQTLKVTALPLPDKKPVKYIIQNEG